MQEDTFLPNLVQIGQEMAEKSSREKKRKIIIKQIDRET